MGINYGRNYLAPAGKVLSYRGKNSKQEVMRHSHSTKSYACKEGNRFEAPTGLNYPARAPDGRRFGCVDRSVMLNVWDRSWYQKVCENLPKTAEKFGIDRDNYAVWEESLGAMSYAVFIAATNRHQLGQLVLGVFGDKPGVYTHVHSMPCEGMQTPHGPFYDIISPWRAAAEAMLRLNGYEVRHIASELRQVSVEFFRRSDALNFAAAIEGEKIEKAVRTMTSLDWPDLSKPQDKSHIPYLRLVK